MFQSNVNLSLKLNIYLTFKTNGYISLPTNVDLMFEKCGSENIENKCLINVWVQYYYFFEVKH